MDYYRWGNTQERVTRGVDWLDENGPADWWDRVDTEILDISDGMVCILGQVFAADANEIGVCSGYLYVLDGHCPAVPGDWFDTQPYGFCGLGFEPNEVLTSAWVEVIDARKALVSA